MSLNGVEPASEEKAGSHSVALGRLFELAVRKGISCDALPAVAKSRAMAEFRSGIITAVLTTTVVVISA